MKPANAEQKSPTKSFRDADGPRQFRRRRVPSSVLWSAGVIVLVAAVAGGLLTQRYLASSGSGQLRSEGTLEAQEITISSEVTSRIVELPADEGVTVHSNDVLVRLDDSVVQAQYQQADSTQRPVLAAELTAYVIHAPEDGVILRRDAQVGEVAVTGEPLLVMANLSTLKLTLYLRQRDLGRVQLGQPVRLVPEALPNTSLTGTVATISDQAEFTPRNTQTAADRLNLVFAVTVKVPNSDGKLKPGMTVNAWFSE